jgi:hypothetical protein
MGSPIEKLTAAMIKLKGYDGVVFLAPTQRLKIFHKAHSGDHELSVSFRYEPTSQPVWRDFGSIKRQISRYCRCERVSHSKERTKLLRVFWWHGGLKSPQISAAVAIIRQNSRK